MDNSNFNIIFQDGSFLVIEKPAGVVVNRSETTASLETVQDWAEKKFDITSQRFPDETASEFVSRGGVVHRLDKDTSGILLLAKTPQAFENLKNQFKERETTKTYYALVHGNVVPAVGEINAPIERSPFHRTQFGIFPGGREACTNYKTLETFLAAVKNNGKEKETLSLLEVHPKTGRTHQIRVHLKYINHPIVCDPLYGGRKTYQQDLKYFPRIFLHAAQIEVNHPITGERMVFESKLPRDLNDALEKVRVKTS